MLYISKVDKIARLFFIQILQSSAFCNMRFMLTNDNNLLQIIMTTSSRHVLKVNLVWY